MPEMNRRDALKSLFAGVMVIPYAGNDLPLGHGDKPPIVNVDCGGKIIPMATQYAVWIGECDFCPSMGGEQILNYDESLGLHKSKDFDYLEGSKVARYQWRFRLRPAKSEDVKRGHISTPGVEFFAFLVSGEDLLEIAEE